MRIFAALALTLFNVFSASCFETEAQYAILVDYETGQILYEKNAYKQMHPSSMTKMMTAYIAFDHLKQGKVSLQDKFKISKKARYMEGSRMFLEQGSIVSFEDLLKGVVVHSGNDASVAVAEALTGSEEVFIDIMNEYAKKLELKNTLFLNCCGLPEEKHLSTAYDLSLLARALITNFGQYYHFFSIKEFEHNKIKQPNWNGALGQYGIDGIKTGRTSMGKHGVALSAANNDGRRLVAVINGLEKYKERTDASIEIIKHGFENFELQELIKRNEANPIAYVKVNYGKEKELPLIANNSISMYVETSAKDKLQMHITHNDFAHAPVAKGEVFGSVSVVDKNGNTLCQTNLIAAKDIEKLGILGRLIYNVNRIFKR